MSLSLTSPPFENVQRILKNAPVKRPNGDGYIHPLSGLLFCKYCGSKLHIRTDRRKDEYKHIALCSEHTKGKWAGRNASHSNK